ncbi:MAG TPA: hypothetical protein VFG30_38335, partial [Polyangiales bacterium]|nr:hypothetical protein [Polyangiales bacterium]
MVHELAARIGWSLAKLGTLVNAGRTKGWLPGEMVEVGDPDAILSDVVEDSVMGALRDHLELSETEIDTLWLLACIEIEPQVARASQMLMSSGMHELSAQIVARLVGDDDGELFDRLAELALIETTADPRLPMYRRAVRVNDRVLDLARGNLGLDREVAQLGELIDESKEIAVPADLRYAVNCGARCWIVASGIEGSGRQTVLRAAAASVGRTVLAV